MRPADRKTFPSLRTVFVSAERRLRANRGMGVPQGLTNNLEDLHRALEGLTEATEQEKEDNAAARAQNEVLQAAVNALQFQMASVVQGGPAINAMQMQQPHQAQIQAQQITGRNQNSNMCGPPSVPRINVRHTKRHQHSNSRHSRKTPSNDNNTNSMELIINQTTDVFSNGDASGDAAT